MRTTSVVIRILVAICAIFVRSASILLFPNLIAPDFVLICIVFCALESGSTIGETTGFISGIIEDFLSISNFGISMLMRTAIGYVTGLFYGIGNVQSRLLPVLLVLIAIGIKFVLSILLGVIFNISTLLHYILSSTFVYESIVTIVYTPIIFVVLSWIPNGSKAQSETEFNN